MHSNCYAFLMLLRSVYRRSRTLERFSTVHERSRSLMYAPERFSTAHERFPTGPTDYDRSEIELSIGQNSTYYDIIFSIFIFRKLIKT